MKYETDLVYPVRESASDLYEELRYSLRSVFVNYSPRSVWLIGGKPRWVTGVGHIATRQSSVKFVNSRINLAAAVGCGRISDPFIMMNDDFFLLEPQNEMAMWHGGDFKNWTAYMRTRLGRSSYIRGAEETLRMLARAGLGRTCWSLHTPLLVHKDPMRHALKLVEGVPQQVHLRTLYGNYAELTGTAHKDIKIVGRQVPADGQLYLSTSDSSFGKAPVGKWVRERFPTPSPWET